MARLMTCGFGTQSISIEPQPETATNTATGSATIAINTANYRYSGASVKYVSASDGTSITTAQFQSTTSAVFARVYFKFDSFPASDCVILALNSSSTDHVWISVTSTGTLKLMSSSGQLGSDSSSMSTGAWYGIELKLDNAASPKAEARVWTDASSSLSSFATGSLGISNNSNTVRFGALSAVSGMTVYATDVSINNSTGSYQNTFPGKGRLVYLRPVAAGDNNSWLKSDGSAGSSTNYQDVDEVTPDDSTSYLKRTTSSQPIDDYEVTTYSSAGLLSTDVINVITVGGRFGATSNTFFSARQVILRIKGQSSGTVAESSGVDVSTTGWLTTIGTGSTFVADPLPTYVNPQDGAAWEPADIDNIQIGVKPSSVATTEVRVSALWVIVEYAPLITTPVSKTYASTWDVSAIIVKTSASTWDINAIVEKTMATTWDVAASTQVTATITTTWDINAFIEKTLTTTWDIFTTASISYASTWDIAAGVIKTYATTWDIADPPIVYKYYDFTWDINSIIEKTHASTWDLYALLDKTVSSTWNVRQQVQKLASYTWDIGSSLLQVTVTVKYPEAYVSIPNLYPRFGVILASSETSFSEFFIDVDVSTDSLFSSSVSGYPVTFSSVHTISPLVNLNRSSVALSDNTVYYVRARARTEYQVSNWSATSMFRVNTGIGDSAEYGHWADVVSTTPTPDLWFVVPSSGEPGTTVTIVGSGFGATPTVHLGATSISPETNTLVSATADAYTSDRQIDGSGGEVDVEHYELVFEVPDVSGPGYSLYVES